MERRISTLLVVAAAAALALAGCGSSKTSGGASSGTTAAPAAANVGTANVSGVGTVLVNSQGRTLYILTSEKGNNVTCISSSGCTSIWFPTVLPSGITSPVAGSGVQASQLGTASASGGTRVTYASYPLYTYSGDTGSGMANGKGITSFGGTWWPISPAGTLVTGSSSSTTAHSGY